MNDVLYSEILYFVLRTVLKIQILMPFLVTRTEYVIWDVPYRKSFRSAHSTANTAFDGTVGDVMENISIVGIKNRSNFIKI